MNTILTQNPLTGNFTIEGQLAPNKVHTFLNGRFDKLHSDKWINKRMQEMSAAPIKREAQKQVGVLTLDLRKGTMIMQGSDYKRSYKASVVGNEVIIR